MLSLSPPTKGKVLFKQPPVKTDEVEEETFGKSDVVFGDPIVGSETVASTHYGQGAP